jgi:adenylate cyclase
LAAILAADIARYSALMAADEEATVRDLKAHQAVILPMVAGHGGRVIDTAGDGVLAEFGSVLDAVKCALAIQGTMVERNALIEASRRMQFRIGINQGDVVVDDARVYGDGVNIAARLEAIADPGGICISDKVYQEIRGKVDMRFEDLGAQQLKNIPEPVRVYRIEAHTAPTGAPPSRPVLTLPDRPSIAVLPFTNLSGDPKEDYFSDGTTEDIITELSRFSDLFVIARNSSFQYKGKSPDIRQVGKELGVCYVLEGSIRRAGDRVRITAQLIDATTGAHRWADRYDRKIEDVFAVQDEVARTIVGILTAHVNKAEAERVLQKPPASWHAHDFYLRAVHSYAAFWSALQVERLYETRRTLEQSISIDPTYARAYALLADSHVSAWIQPLDADYRTDAALDRAYQLARKAIQLDPRLEKAHGSLGYVLTFKREHDASVAAFEKAIALNPNYSNSQYCAALAFAGEYDRTISVAQVHMRVDPFYPPYVVMWVGAALYCSSGTRKRCRHLSNPFHAHRITEPPTYGSRRRTPVWLSWTRHVAKQRKCCASTRISPLEGQLGLWQPPSSTKSTSSLTLTTFAKPACPNKGCGKADQWVHKVKTWS